MIFKNKSIRLGILFAAFLFAQFVILRMGNQAGRGYLSPEQQEYVYIFLQISIIPGYLIYGLLKKLFKGETRRKALTAGTLTLCLAGAETMLFLPESSLLYLTVTGVTVFLLGVSGGAVYDRATAFTAAGARVGLCLGAGYGMAVALQYFMQLNLTIKPLIAPVLVLAFAVLAAALMKHAPEPESGFAEDKRSLRGTLARTAVITLTMLIFTCYYNSYIHHLQIASGYTDYNVYSWPRLLMIAGIMLFGVIGDFRDGRLLPLSTLCMVVLALLNALLIGRETYLLNMCLYYLAISASIAYYNLTFLRLAPRTKHPALWACTGRVLDSVVVMISFLLGFANLSAVAVLVIDIAALVVIIVLMAINGDFNLSAPKQPESEDAAEPQPQTDPFDEIRGSFGLTPTELKVFRELVLTDDKQDVIALRLNMSVNTLRHHVTSIYKKTGAQTRAALCKLANPI